MKIVKTQVILFRQRRLGALALLAAMLVLPFASSIAARRAPYQPENGFVSQLSSREADVLEAVQQVTEDQIIHGTYSYEKERTLYGAHGAAAAPVFGPWEQSGKVFYKIASKILAPKFFKDSGDIGTISVRYVVQSVNANTTTVRIDAVFVDARNVQHASKGQVEAAEYKAIEDALAALDEGRNKARQAVQANLDNRAASTTPGKVSAPSSTDAGEHWSLGLTLPQLEQRVSELRHEAELQTKNSGALLKSAPFRSSPTLASLPAKTEVAIVVLTPYWYGVETEDGHRGWIHRSELEPLE